MRKRFFLKNKQKLSLVGVRVEPPRTLICKSFLVLFFKKELLPYSASIITISQRSGGPLQPSQAPRRDTEGFTL
jgi:hypothetical protein